MCPVHCTFIVRIKCMQLSVVCMVSYPGPCLFHQIIICILIFVYIMINLYFIKSKVVQYYCVDSTVSCDTKQEVFSI